MAADIAALSHAMLRFMHTPEQGVGTEVEAALQRLSTVAVSQRDLQALVAHGRLIMEVLPQVDTLLRQIITPRARLGSMPSRMPCCSMPTGSRHARKVFRVLLYLVAVILLGYLLYQFARLRAHARTCACAIAGMGPDCAALRASEERFRAITESANDAIISADSTGNIVSWNTRAEAIFGYKAEEILGAPPHASDTRPLPGGPRAALYAVVRHRRVAPGRHNGGVLRCAQRRQ